MTTNEFNTGRDLDWPTLLDQIGRWTVLAISGGRVVRLGKSAVSLPVGRGYSVRVILEADDTYTVQRVYSRRPKGETVKGEVTGVYCDDIEEVAYVAACFVNRSFGDDQRVGG